MIVEMRTYSYRPGTLQQALDRIALGVDERTKLSPLGGLWFSDIGRQHQIVHLWPYDSLSHREEVRGRFSELKHWPAKTGEFTVESETKILKPAPFSPPLRAGKLGPVYEICTDLYRPNALDRIVDAWSARIERRARLAPFVGAWSSALGPMYQWVHVWAYESLAQRQAVREAAAREDCWPPAGDPGELYLRQDSAIFHPAPFSPLQ